MNKLYTTFLALLLTFASTASWSQSVSGVVKDASGSPLIGVNISVLEDANKGTITDIDGNFNLSVNDLNHTLVFSYVGYESQKISIAGRFFLPVTMSEDAAKLEEVIVIGYGVSKKAEVIGAVDNVSSKTLKMQPITNYSQALAGQVAGLQIRETGGSPGGGPELLIRGIGSISAGNEPLIVIDGFPYGNYNAERNNFLSLVDPNDIEDITIIRDASGKAIYGSRAANGLIMITTKSGFVGKPTIEAEVNTGWQSIPGWEKPNMMNATELAQFHRERFEDEWFTKNGEYPAEEDIPEHVRNPSQYGEGTDWWDALTQTGQITNYRLSLRGGNKSVKYSVSSSYLSQTGTIITSDFKRYNLRANLDAEVTDWLDVGINLAPSWSDNNTGRIDPGAGQFSVYNALNVARWADPTGQIYNEDGTFTRDTRGVLTQFYQGNPVKRLEEERNVMTNRQLFAGINLKARLMDGLHFKTFLSTNVISNRGRTFVPAEVQASGLEPSFTNVTSTAAAGRYENVRLLSEYTLNYKKKFSNDKHMVDAVLGYAAEQTQETFINIGSGFVNIDDFELASSGNTLNVDPNNPETVRVNFNGGESISEQALLSYFGRLIYDYDDKYYLSLSARSDGSSRFGPNRRYAVFPAVGVGYRLSKESWFPKSRTLTNVRFSGSYGLSGNNRIGNYQWQGGVGRGSYIIGDQLVNTGAVGGIPNFDLTWEETTQLDLGIALGFIDDRIELKSNYYRAETEGLLFGAPLPTITGFGNKLVNIGAIENTGWEFTLNTSPVKNDDFIWTISSNVTVNRNKVLRLGPDGNPIFTIPAGNSSRAGITEVGQPIGQFYGLEITGLYTEEMLADESIPKYPGASVGSPVYTDVNGDGVLDRSALDRTVIGDPWADFNFGFNMNFAYKALSLRINSYGEYGSEILDLTREFTQNTDKGNGQFLGVFNVDREVQDRWRPGDTDFSVRPPSTINAASSQRWRWPSSAGVFDGSFWKISNISLALNLDEYADKWRGVGGGSVYCTFQNPFILKSYYRNPEIRRSSAGTLERNVDYSGYPTNRTVTVGALLRIQEKKLKEVN